MLRNEPSDGRGQRVLALGLDTALPSLEGGLGILKPETQLHSVSNSTDVHAWVLDEATQKHAAYLTSPPA